MIVLDLIIAVLLGYALFKGVQNGLVVSVISLVALLVGIYFSLRFSFFTRDFLIDNTQWNPNTITVAAFFITFVLVLFALYGIGKLVTKMVDSLALGFVNKLAGALFEGVKMILIISVFLNLFQKINFNNLLVSEEKLNESIFYKPVESISKIVFPLMDKWYKLALQEATDGLKEMKENEKPLN
ncbi:MULTISPECIES: CvpA family protein [unclassified Flavobacterium]|uniref:CvpA family protein n=1 Tax=unclassified Flavobacterium TaxID=196869 RepID=UPI0013D7AC4A|nr:MULTISPECIES: CvpA family protein [unclassified Flavobacterium]MBA5792181.1 CvpA family protein [Flavobacterium sp. xlx-221]